ncbi:MAG: ATP-binding protein [Pseudomonadota bacterium]
MKTLLKNLIPAFVKHKKNAHLDPFYTFTDYWHIWTMTIFALLVAALSPLWIVTVIHYQLIERSVDSELTLRTERLTSNAKRTIAFFMEERLNALTFTVNEMGFEQLTDNDELQKTLKNLKLGFGGLTDLSVIDNEGSQIAYAGPYNLEGKSYKTQPWFLESIQNTNFISEVFTGYRGVPHIIIAVRALKPDGSFFILRATLDTARLMQNIASYKVGTHADIFLINHQGLLQTPSANLGEIFTKVPFQVPEYSHKTVVYTKNHLENDPEIMGYAYISTDLGNTPFILMVIKKKIAMMDTWLNLRKDFNRIIGASAFITLIILVIASTIMINKLYLADRTKAETMLRMEQSQQLAAIGQLAAGVAHEINNPLALINETAGYVKDVLSYGDQKPDKTEILEYIDSILEAVERCGTITRQLLGFVRQFDLKVRKVNLKTMVEAVLSFHKKEAEYRRINVTSEIPETIPDVETDSGKLQQIMVNIVNNAFQAVEDESCVEIDVSQPDAGHVSIVIKDTGCGIPEENLKRIQEPFFSTKKEKGTGLGLSITYSLVKKLHGAISVQSTEGVGTVFTITLPVNIQKEV